MSDIMKGACVLLCAGLGTMVAIASASSAWGAAAAIGAVIVSTLVNEVIEAM